ncbi:MAG: type I glyceraldehyde-3-phosphate dehydrogenase [Halioglobus sp.]
MGFGQIGRQIFDLAAQCDDIDVVAIADIGSPEILHYLLASEVKAPGNYRIDGNFLACDRFRARLMQIDEPHEMPWDIFGVDLVIDTTGRFRQASDMQDHLDNGAPRVLLRTLPVDNIDRIVVPGVNEADADAADLMISAGSPTTNALCLLLHALAGRFAIECASMTTVHAYTSDQALQDYAGSDFRRSRSAAKNIIPNTHEASLWLGHILPAFDGKVLTSALNVPVQEGCLLDLTLVMEDAAVTVDDVNQALCNAADGEVLSVVEDPIVSSDVIGNSSSLLFDLKGTIKAGEHTVKTLGWYESLGHAARLLDVARLYRDLDSAGEVA